MCLRGTHSICCVETELLAVDESGRGGGANSGVQMGGGRGWTNWW